MSTPPDAVGLLQRLIAALTADPAWTLVGGGAQGAVVRTDDRALLLVPVRDTDPAWITGVVGTAGELPVEVLAFGGERHEAQALTAAAPQLPWVHVGPDGRSVHAGAAVGSIWAAAWLARTPEVEEELRAYARALRRTAAPVGPPLPPARPPSGFVRWWDSREPLISYWIVAANVLMFGVQVYTGATDDGRQMLALGALIGSPLSLLTPWTLVSYAFLHADPVHLLGNMLAIGLNGALLEQMLGRARVWLLYLGSAIGGGVAIALFGGNGLTIGASGAAWGLMTGALVLVLREPGITGFGARAALLPALGRNFLLNLLLSFVPGVSLAGHLGGGLVGALLIGTRLLLIGAGPSRKRREGLPAWMAILALLGVFFVLGSEALAIALAPTILDALDQMGI